MSTSSSHLMKLLGANHERMGLALAALALSKESDPAIDVTGYMNRIAALASDICRRLPPAPATGDVLYALNTCLFDELEFSRPLSEGGSAAPFMHTLLDERRGETVSFVIFYLTLGRLLHLPLEGVSFSGRLLLRLADGGDADVIDPCAGGVILTLAELKDLFESAVGGAVTAQPKYHLFLERMDDRAILVRLLRRHKAFHLARHHFDSALSTVEAILNIAPGEAVELLDRARLLEEMAAPQAAAAGYFHYLEHHPGSPHTSQLRERLRWLLGKEVVLH